MKKELRISPLIYMEMGENETKAEAVARLTDILYKAGLDVLNCTLEPDCGEVKFSFEKPEDHATEVVERSEGYVTEAVEVCPHCGAENLYPGWDSETSGYIAVCRTCGKKIFLCDECTHAGDNTEHKCDWEEVPCNGGKCFRGKIEPEMNTVIRYMYRDGNNYKVYQEAVVSGILTEKQEKEIMGCLEDGTYFIPCQVGLQEERFDEIAPEDDHAWFEFQETEKVPADKYPPTVDMTAEDLCLNFLKTRKDGWDDTLWLKYNEWEV